MNEKISIALEFVKSARMTYNALEKKENVSNAELTLASAIIDWRSAQHRALVEENKVNDLLDSYRAALGLVS